MVLCNISPVLQRLTRNLTAPSSARGQLDIRFHSQTRSNAPNLIGDVATSSSGGDRPVSDCLETT